MAISNELSSEIAAALLSKKTSRHELKQLRDVILKVHDTLQEMQKEASRKNGETRRQDREANSEQAKYDL